MCGTDEVTGINFDVTQNVIDVLEIGAAGWSYARCSDIDFITPSLHRIFVSNHCKYKNKI